MRRSILLLALIAVALGGLALLAAVLGVFWFWPASQPTYEADLAAPIPAESAEDFAAALPTIDEFRHHRGSLLAGTLLEDAPEPEPPRDNSYIELLRREARRLDSLAADHEDQNDYDRAENLRFEADQLRSQARELIEERNPTQFSDYERR